MKLLRLAYALEPKRWYGSTCGLCEGRAVCQRASPILVTVDPQSSALLRLELPETRRWEDWKQLWECLEDNGYHAIYLVCDGSQAITKAQKKTLVDSVRQPDTSHAIAHRFGGYVKQRNGRRNGH